MEKTERKFVDKAGAEFLLWQLYKKGGKKLPGFLWVASQDDLVQKCIEINVAQKFGYTYEDILNTESIMEKEELQANNLRSACDKITKGASLGDKYKDIYAFLCMKDVVLISNFPRKTK